MFAVEVLRKSIHGFSVLSRGRLGFALLMFVLTWLLMFAVMMPIALHATWIVEERAAVGDLSPAMPPEGRCAFVTLVTGDAYVRGARVLAHTLRVRSHFDFPLVAMAVRLSASNVALLREVGWTVLDVDPIPFRPPDASYWPWKPEQKLAKAHVNALSKMRVWELLTDYDRAVFVDADAWVLGDISDLCRRQEDIAVMGSIHGPDLNSGVMSLRPNASLFRDFMKFWRDEPDHLRVYHRPDPRVLANPDQSLIMGFARRHPWLRVGPLSAKYNLNGRQKMWSDVRIIHFNVDAVKPWSIDLEGARRHYAAMKAEGDAMSARVW